MIKKFEPGKWYLWIGPKKRPNYFSGLGSMDFVLDGRPHRVKTVEHDGRWASFYDQKNDTTWAWDLSHFAPSALVNIESVFRYRFLELE